MTTVSISVSSPSDFDTMNTSLLRTYCQQLGISQMGKKTELIARCKESFGKQTTVAPSQAGQLPDLFQPKKSAPAASAPTAPTAAIIQILGHTYADMGDKVVSVGQAPAHLAAEYPVVPNNGQRVVHVAENTWVGIGAAPQGQQLAAPSTTAAPRPANRVMYRTAPDQVFELPRNKETTRPTFVAVERSTNWGLSFVCVRKEADGSILPNSSHNIRFGTTADIPVISTRFLEWAAREVAAANAAQ